MSELTADQKKLMAALPFMKVYDDVVLDKSIFNNVFEGSILVSSSDGNYKLFNPSCLNLGAPLGNPINPITFNDLLPSMRLLENSNYDFSKYIILEDNQYKINLTTTAIDTIDTQVVESLKYICNILNSSRPIYSLEESTSKFFYGGPMGQKPMPSEREFSGRIRIVAGLVGSATPIEIIEPDTRNHLTPLKEQGKYIDGTNILAIYLQACNGAKLIDQVLGDEMTALEAEVNGMSNDTLVELLRKQKIYIALQKLLPLTEGDHLERFILGELQLSEPEKEFLKTMNICPGPQSILTTLIKRLNDLLRLPDEAGNNKKSDIENLIQKPEFDLLLGTNDSILNELFTYAVSSNHLDIVKKLLDQMQISKENFIQAYDIARLNNYQDIALEITKKQLAIAIAAENNDDIAELTQRKEFDWLLQTDAEYIQDLNSNYLNIIPLEILNKLFDIAIKAESGTTYITTQPIVNLVLDYYSSNRETILKDTKNISLVQQVLRIASKHSPKTAPDIEIELTVLKGRAVVEQATRDNQSRRERLAKLLSTTQ